MASKSITELNQLLSIIVATKTKDCKICKGCVYCWGSAIDCIILYCCVHPPVSTLLLLKFLVKHQSGLINSPVIRQQCCLHYQYGL